MNKLIKILLIADIIWFFGEGMLGPLFAVFTGRVGGDVLDITWAWASYLIITGLLIVVVGKVSDRIGQKKLVFTGYVLNAILTFSYLLVDSPLKLLFVQAGLGIAAALATPTWDALYSKYENKKEAGYVWGLSDGLSEFLTGIAIIIGGLIVTYFSFTTLFLTMGIIQILSVVCLFNIFRK